MPLEAYLRGKTWWARGTVEINGRPVSEYIRESTKSSTERGAKDWIAEREALEIRRHHVGEEAEAMTFARAVELYKPTPDMAKYLIPILKEFGPVACRSLTAELVRDLAKRLYPDNSADSWKRWVITPTRAVVNGAHARYPNECPRLHIADFSPKERIEQDKKRGKKSRVRKTPGSWEWLLKFRTKASKRNGALALFMFTTGARIGQAVAMRPDHLDLDNKQATIPGAKGHDDRVVTLTDEMVADLRALKPRVPRGWDNKAANLRVFGYAERQGPLKNWRKACKDAGIDYLPPHSAGRHGFGQEMRVRQGVDTKAIEDVGGWSPAGGMVDRTYTHAENTSAKVLKALRTGRVQAEKKTGLKAAEKVQK